MHIRLPASRRVSPPFRVLHERRWSGSLDSDAFRAFLPRGTIGRRGPVRTGFACPPPSALRVWLPSRRFTPSPAQPGLNPGSARGPAPSELRLASGCPAFPPDAPRLPLSADLASMNQRFAEAGTCEPGFRVLPQERPAGSGRTEVRPSAGDSPGVLCPLQGSPASALNGLSAALLSRAWS